MISRNQDKSIFEAHWDWFAAIAGLAVLAATAAWLFLLSGDPLEESRDSGAGQPQKVEPVSMKAFEEVSARLAKPPRVAEIPDAKGSFLASELRVFCSQGDANDTRKTCGLPIPHRSEICPFCKARQQPVEKPEFDRDTDGDGLKDDWEKKFGLNPNDPGDADQDKDGDGFTNIEEFAAGTDPTDKDSHPDYLDYLSLKPELKQTYTYIVFTGANKTPHGIKLAFTDPSRSGDYNRGRYSVYVKDEIGTSGFVVKRYEKKHIEKTIGGGMKKKEDVSEVILERKSDGKNVTLKISRKRTPVDVQATLVYDRQGGKTYDVTAGETISLNGCEFKIIEIAGEGKDATVVVENVKTGRRRTIKALE